MDYVGVVFREDHQHWEARIRWQKRLIYLKTHPTAEIAAKVRDIAVQWLQGPDAHINCPELPLPPDVTEAHIAYWLLENRVPLSFLAFRVPIPILLQIGITKSDLLAAGVPIATVLQHCCA